MRMIRKGQHWGWALPLPRLLRFLVAFFLLAVASSQRPLEEPAGAVLDQWMSSTTAASSSSAAAAGNECAVAGAADASSSCLAADSANPKSSLARRNEELQEGEEATSDDDADKDDHDYTEHDDDDDDDDYEEKEEWKPVLDTSEEWGVRQKWDYDPMFPSKLGDDLAYYRQFVGNDAHRHLVDECRNRHARCTEWALDRGGVECETNFRYMKMVCPVACRSCDWLDVRARCAPDPNESDAFRPGDLDRLFERIATDPGLAEHFPRPHVLSRPTYAAGDTNETANYGIGLWLVVLPTFLSEEEADRMVGVVERSGLAPSKGLAESDTGEAISEVTDARTSWNSFCDDACHDDPAHQRMLARAELLLGLPQRNFEHSQLLRYHPGQYYTRHNDFINGHRNDPMGPRILTLFVYLSDVTDGGGTNFPELNLTVQPRKGAAVLWPSVFNDALSTEDPRADHEALPVLEGVKYGANIWVHQRDFKAAYAKDCVETTTTVIA